MKHARIKQPLHRRMSLQFTWQEERSRPPRPDYIVHYSAKHAQPMLIKLTFLVLLEPLSGSFDNRPAVDIVSASSMGVKERNIKYIDQVTYDPFRSARKFSNRVRKNSVSK
jgi:hypothetical protein